MKNLNCIWLGRVSYSKALDIMETVASKIKEGNDEILLLMEHDPVITLGRNGDKSNLLLTPAQYRERDIEFFNIKRGGDVTFHGPGQIVGYPIMDVGRKVKTHVNHIFDAIKDMLALDGISAFYDDSNPGLWVGNRKIAAVGIEIKDGISRHGFSLNIKPDFSGFDLIVPCGLSDKGVVYMSELTEVQEIKEIAIDFAYRFAGLYRRTIKILHNEEFLSVYGMN